MIYINEYPLSIQYYVFSILKINNGYILPQNSHIFFFKGIYSILMS